MTHGIYSFCDVFKAILEIELKMYIVHLKVLEYYANHKV